MIININRPLKSVLTNARRHGLSTAAPRQPIKEIIMIKAPIAIQI